MTKDAYATVDDIVNTIEKQSNASRDLGEKWNIVQAQSFITSVQTTTGKVILQTKDMYIIAVSFKEMEVIVRTQAGERSLQSYTPSSEYQPLCGILSNWERYFEF